MIPMDGTGYGKSLYWEMKSKQLARRNQEYCPCWDLRNPVIEFSQDGQYKISVGCSMPMDTCVQDFHKTDKALTLKFKEFYGK